MTGKVYRFPAVAVIQAIRQLETHQGPIEADALACSIVLLAIRRGEPAPGWSVTLLLSTLLRYVEEDHLAWRLAVDLGSLDHSEVRAVGLDLVERAATHHVQLGKLLLARRLGGHGFPLGR